MTEEPFPAADPHLVFDLATNHPEVTKFSGPPAWRG